MPSVGYKAVPSLHLLLLFLLLTDSPIALSRFGGMTLASTISP
jgi:hypothetical protein